MWTTEQKLAYLLQLPWTIETSREDEDVVLRVKELPSVIATGQTQTELEADFWESLRATLESYLHFGDQLPLPKEATRLPWEPSDQAPEKVALNAGHRPPSIEVVPVTETQLRVQSGELVAA